MFPTLTDEQRRFVSTVRELAQSEFRERAQRYFFMWALILAMYDDTIPALVLGRLQESVMDKRAQARLVAELRAVLSEQPGDEARMVRQ